MSVKRQATTELNHDNWDKDDPADHEEIGSFKIASQDILEKRVIRTAKRRSQANIEEPKKSVFSSFDGFNKEKPASFDFLSKVTNGNNENNSLTSKADSTGTSSLFTSKPFAVSPGAGFLSTNPNTATSTKSPFGPSSTLSAASTLFGVSSTNTTLSNNFKTNVDTTLGDSSPKMQTVTSSPDSKIDPTRSTLSNTLTSSKFDIPTANNTAAKSLFSSTSSPSLLNIQPKTNPVENNLGMIKKSESNITSEAEKSDDVKSEARMKYYSKLKHLNESVCDWIKKHVEQTPLCILTPIFKDYERYIKQIQDEYQSSDKTEKLDNKRITSHTQLDNGSLNAKPAASEKNNSTSSKSIFAPQNKSPETTEKPATFSFGMNISTISSSKVTSSPPTFSFGVSTSTESNTNTSSPFSTGTASASSFSFAANTDIATSNASTTPFSFGIGKPFSFNSNIKQNTEKTEENKDEEEDTPPKVEYTPVVEENSVYDKKCKIFVKKDGNFVDKGIGTLYIKKIEESNKHQLLVRANTNLGSILINLILVSGIPTQRMGKNNVMMVCIPTPDSKPPPTPILIRVKTTEEADELLATLEKYKT